MGLAALACDSVAQLHTQLRESPNHWLTWPCLGSIAALVSWVSWKEWRRLGGRN